MKYLVPLILVLWTPVLAQDYGTTDPYGFSDPFPDPFGGSTYQTPAPTPLQNFDNTYNQPSTILVQPQQPSTMLVQPQQPVPPAGLSQPYQGLNPEPKLDAYGNQMLNYQ